MTVINTNYKQWKVEQKCLCDLSVGEFFQFPRENVLYRCMGKARQGKGEVLNLETLEADNYDLAVVVHKVKVKEVNISVEFESE